jgi:hypothetical protein
MADTQFTEQDMRDNGSCGTLIELLETVGGGEALAGRMANWRTLRLAAQEIEKSTPEDDARVSAHLSKQTGGG